MNRYEEKQIGPSQPDQHSLGGLRFPEYEFTGMAYITLDDSSEVRANRPILGLSKGPCSRMQYTRAKKIFQEAVEYLCCGSEDLRGRLRSLDPELFQFKASDIPDIEGLSMQLKELNELANSISEKHNEGSLAATFSSAQKGKLERIAKIIYSMDIALAKHA